jgi:nucleotide-binding universal stress UspA family protein
MTTTKKKILVGVDDSERSYETVRYVSKIPLFQKMEVVLFHVFHKIPEAYWDLETAKWRRGDGPQIGWRIKDARAWETERQKKIQAFMEKARQLLVDAGCPRDAVIIKVHEKKKGIARDILSEAQRGSRAIAVGRRGMGKVKGLILGSVTTKLLEKVSFAPLHLIGKKSSPEKVLIALDGSAYSMRGVDYVGSCLGGSDFKVNLIHIIRGDEKQYVQQAKQIITAIFDDAKNRLEKSGFKPSQVTTKIITGQESRADAIVREARQSGYSTIVVGRKGLSKVEEFSIGRVSNKVVYLSKGLAVWVVN